MPNDAHVAMLRRGAAAWNAWRETHDEAPDLSLAALRGTHCAGANLAGAHLEGANLFKAVLDGADLAGAYLYDAQFLNCAQLVVARGWQSPFRDGALACGAPIPLAQPRPS